MAGTQAQSIDRNIDAAARFLDRVKGLSPSEREGVSRESFGSSAHTSAMMMIADEVSALRNKDQGGRVSSFLVELERRVDEMGLDAEAGDLVKAAARALLVKGAPALDRAAQQLYMPFEQVVPYLSVAD